MINGEKIGNKIIRTNTKYMWNEKMRERGSKKKV